MPLVRIKDTDEVVQFPDDMRAQEILAKLREYRPPNYSDALQKPPSMAMAYEPTLAEKMGQGISNALYDSGIISNRFAAQNIGRNATTGAEVLPVIGDALGADELGRAIKEGDAAGIGLGALSMVPVVGEVGVKKLNKAEFLKEFMDMPLFHGTNKDLKEFDLSLGGSVSKSPVGKLGISVTPDIEIAKEYAKLSAENGGNPTVLELVHRAKSPAMIELDGTERNLEMAATVSQAWDDGYDAIMLKNYKTPGSKKLGTVIIVKEPNQLRKKGAKFDPDKKFSPELLAGLGGLAVIPLIGNDEQEDSYQKN